MSHIVQSFQSYFMAFHLKIGITSAYSLEMETSSHSNELQLATRVKMETDLEYSTDTVPSQVMLLPEHMRVKVEVEFDAKPPAGPYSDMAPSDPGDTFSETRSLAASIPKLGATSLLQRTLLAPRPCPPSAPLSNTRATSNPQASHSRATSEQQTSGIDQKIKNFVCDPCGKIYKKKPYLITHLHKHFKIKGNTEINTIKNTEKNTIKNTESKTIKKKRIRKKTYDCGTCGHKFPSESELQTHQITEGHNGTWKVPCDICNKQFSCKSALNYHKKIHTGHKPLSCIICEKRFRQRNELNLHMRIHTGEKPYPCKTCEKRFRTKGDLSLHIRIHTGEKPYKCDICFKSFKASDAMTKHRRIHTGQKPYKCETCDMQFTHRGGYTSHQRIHTGEKPYTCEACGKSFRQSSRLSMHRRTHTGEKFPCDICGKQYTRPDKLNAHKRKHYSLPQD